MEQITCELNGIKYLLVERQYTESKKKKFEAILTKHECIFQGISWFPKFAILKILVPEKNVIAFNEEDL